MRLFEVLVSSPSRNQLRELTEFHLDLHYRAARQEAPKRFVVPGVLNEDEIERVRAAGYDLTILHDLAKVSDVRLAEVSRTNRFKSGPALAEMVDLAVRGYMTVEEAADGLSNISAQYSDLVELIEMPERTWERRTCHAVRVGGREASNGPGVLFTGGVHAREWGGSDICMGFLTNLLNAYTSRSALQFGAKVFTPQQVETIVNRLHLFVFPLVNPDGRHYSQTVFPMWRKNRNPNTNVDPRYPGVDINRNFDFLWSSDFGASTDPADDTYKGEEPFSEPETRNVRHLFDAYPNIRYYTDIHSYSGLILHAWGDDVNQSEYPDQNFFNADYDGRRGRDEDAYGEFISPMDLVVSVGTANRMNSALARVRGTRYTVQQGFGLYPTIGTSSDYAFCRDKTGGPDHEVVAFTIEFGNEFQPRFTEMERIIMEVCAAMTELCWIAAMEG